MLASVERYRNDLFSIEEEERGAEDSFQVAQLQKAREGARAVAYDGLVYVVGGQDEKGEVLSCGEKYSPKDNSWLPIAPMRSPRVGFRVAVVEDRMLVVGGRTKGGHSLDTVEMFCLMSNTWVVEVAQLPSPKVDFVLVRISSEAILASTLDRMRCNGDAVVLRAQSCQAYC